MQACVRWRLVHVELGRPRDSPAVSIATDFMAEVFTILAFGMYAAAARCRGVQVPLQRTVVEAPFPTE
eukprot:10559529-Lingulodinium_polyedra.AAC.1